VATVCRWSGQLNKIYVAKFFSILFAKYCRNRRTFVETTIDDRKCGHFGQWYIYCQKLEFFRGLDFCRGQCGSSFSWFDVVRVETYLCRSGHLGSPILVPINSSSKCQHLLMDWYIDRWVFRFTTIHIWQTDGITRATDCHMYQSRTWYKCLEQTTWNNCWF